MKDEWIHRYREAAGKERDTVDVLLGFNANIDVIFDAGEVALDLEQVEPVEHEKVTSLRELKEALRYCRENGLNKEMEMEGVDNDFQGGEERLGGQAGIMSNFLSNLGNGVIFYTPLLSEELASKINEKVLSPVIDGNFVLKNVRDASNTDRTKKNLIFEYEGEKTGRVIFSETMKGFGPYLRKGIEDNLAEIEDNIDRAIFSGFHDVEGNREAKLKKSRNQLRKISRPVHIEYVHREGIAELLFKHVIPEADSIGLDEAETREVAELLDLEADTGDEPSLGDVFNVSKELIERFGLDRCHVHTYDFHLTVTTDDYGVGQEEIRDGMLFGQLSAVLAASKGDYPVWEDYSDFEMEGKHLRRLDDLEHFQHFFGLEDFAHTGIAEVEGLKVTAVPTLIVEEPEKLVGLGDIISSGAFIGELK